MPRQTPPAFSLPHYYNGASLNSAVPTTILAGANILVAQPYIPFSGAKELTFYGKVSPSAGGVAQSLFNVTADVVDADGADQLTDLALITSIGLASPAATYSFQITLTERNGGYYIIRAVSGTFVEEGTIFYCFGAMHGIGFTIANGVGATSPLTVDSLGLSLR